MFATLSSNFKNSEATPPTTAMFSAGDAKDIFQLFPPQKTSDFLPSLILSSGGHGFVTLEFAKAQFRSRVTKGAERILVSSLADDLDIGTDLVLQLVRTHSGLALLSANKSSIITIDERDALLQKLSDGLSNGLIQISTFRAENDLDENSLQALVKDVDGVVEEHNGHLFSKAYEQKVFDSIDESIQSSLSSLSAVDVIPQDLPGVPPLWFTLCTLSNVMDSRNLNEAYFVKQNANGAQCYPKKLIEQNRDAVINDLKSGKLAFVDLLAFREDFPELYSSIEDARQHVQSASDAEVIDTFAIPRTKRSNLTEACIQSLAEEGRVDLAHILANFPGSLQSRLLPELVRDIDAKYQTGHGTPVQRVGDFLLKPESYESERRVLLDYADVDAGLQWQRLRENPESEVKFSLSNIVAMITKEQQVLATMIKEKAIEKAIEERFWASISQHEAEIEAQFSDFWVERVQSRCQIYQNGLDAVQDEKLQDQLSEIFAVYVKKELIPDSIAKARSQGLVLSRKTRKNISAIEDSLKQDDSSLSAVLAALRKFNKKQGIEALDGDQAIETKQTMVNDMIRRMQKQKKSDGPVLFLTLVLILFAKHNDVVVYATGKFAPKLLKQLKSSLPAEQYEQMEKWKEAAKTSALTAEDRAAMKDMAEV
ncbi:hypothetical protein NX059_005192 [Plenodomus lindquistii]|nr:hypothetical protein NX059_005192 [Plenodomus lindquistii]